MHKRTCEAGQEPRHWPGLELVPVPVLGLGLCQTWDLAETIAGAATRAGARPAGTVATGSEAETRMHLAGTYILPGMH